MSALLDLTEPWTEQPQFPAPLRRDIWTPDFIWSQPHGPQLINKRVIARNGTPGIVRPARRAVGISHNGSSQYENYIADPVISSAYPLAYGAVFVVQNTGAATQTAVGYGGSTLSSGLYGGVGQYTSTNIGGWGRHATGAGDANLSGPAAVLGVTYAVAFVSRAQTTHALFVNGVKYSGTGDGGVPNDSILNFTIGASVRATTPIFYAYQNVSLGWLHQGYDPGDAWLLEWSRNPWQIFAPYEQPIWIPVSAGGASNAPRYFHRTQAGMS